MLPGNNEEDTMTDKQNFIATLILTIGIIIFIAIIAL